MFELIFKFLHKFISKRAQSNHYGYICDRFCFNIGKFEMIAWIDEITFGSAIDILIWGRELLVLENYSDKPNAVRILTFKRHKHYKNNPPQKHTFELPF